MRFPNKVTPYQESILAKFPIVLKLLEEQEMKPIDLFNKVKNKVSDIGEFLEILECLYALRKTEFNKEGGTLRYVNRNLL